MYYYINNCIYWCLTISWFRLYTDKQEWLMTNRRIQILNGSHGSKVLDAIFEVNKWRTSFQGLSMDNTQRFEFWPTVSQNAL